VKKPSFSLNHKDQATLGAANYALQAVHRAAGAPDAAAAAAKERDWQYQRLLKLQNKREVWEIERVFTPACASMP
jgi:hypothetical protein